MIKVSMTEETLVKALQVHTSLTNDKHLNQDFKNVILWLEPDLSVRMASYGITTSVGNIIDAQVVADEEITARKLIQLKLKDIQTVLDGYKGVTTIFISTIDFIIEDNIKAIMHVHEKTADEEKYGDQFDNVADYLIRQSPVAQVVDKEISKINFNFEGEEIPTEIFDMYLGALHPQILNEVSSATDSVYFKEDYIYTRNSTNVMIMTNIISDIIPETLESLRDFKLNKSNVAFVLDMISGTESFQFARQDLERNGVQLTIRVEDTIAVLNVPNTANAVDLTSYLQKQGAKIVLDRQYLVDVLKQASTTPETIKFTAIFNQDGKEDTLQIESKSMKKPLIVNSKEGSCDVAIEIKPELLNRLIAGYSKKFTQDIVIYLHVSEKGTIELTVEDTGGLWYTKIREIRPAKGVYWK